MSCVYKDKWPLYPEIKYSNDNGEDESALPTTPELTLVIFRQKAFTPLARDPVWGQFKRAEKSGQSIPVIQS